jgi:hypothetical protein
LRAAPTIGLLNAGDFECGAKTNLSLLNRSTVMHQEDLTFKPEHLRLIDFFTCALDSGKSFIQHPKRLVSPVIPGVAVSEKRDSVRLEWNATPLREHNLHHIRGAAYAVRD